MGKKMGLFLVIALLFLCSGCIPSVELNERAIVQAIGVDSVKGGYRVSLQIFSPGGGDGPTEIDAGQQNAKMITAEGKTISDAIQQATLEQGRQIFYGHNRLLVIGESTVKKGISNILPFFNSGYQSRPSINVMAAEGTAEGILSANIQQGIIPAESLEKMVANYSENGSVMQTNTCVANCWTMYGPNTWLLCLKKSRSKKPCWWDVITTMWKKKRCAG